MVLFNLSRVGMGAEAEPLRKTRDMCVTTTPTGIPNAFPGPRWPSLRPTPSRAVSSSMVVGTLPLCLSRSVRQEDWIFLALFRKQSQSLDGGREFWAARWHSQQPCGTGGRVPG